MQQARVFVMFAEGVQVEKTLHEEREWKLEMLPLPGSGAIQNIIFKINMLAI
ncbi:hypothetical protein AB9F47_25260 [Rhizobium leguminosarum]|uniref:hypothetical protein n=1 Tax=Rhizobium leguminosarum TaxID=384 RepID=UPI003F9524E4